VHQDANLPETIGTCLVIVEVLGGAEIARFEKSPDEVTALGGSGYRYFFDVDIQDFMQRYLAPNRTQSSMFNTLGTFSTSINTDATVELRMRFNYRKRDADGILQVPFTADTVDGQEVTIAIRQNGDDFDLVDLTVASPPMLSNAPSPRKTFEGLNSFLSFYNQDATVNCMRVQVYPGGAYHYTDFTALPAEQVTVSAGYENIDSTLSSAWLNGDDKPNLSAATGYIVDFGVVTFDGSRFVTSYTSKSASTTYEVGTVCNKKLRFYFLNSLGGVDEVLLPYTGLEDEVSANSFEKPLDATHRQSDYGRLRNNIKHTRKYLVSTKLTSTRATWLRELLNSAEVYIQNPDLTNNYWRVFPANASQITRKTNGLIDFSFELEISQDIKTHRV
jgi:hypothetical protein